MESTFTPASRGLIGAVRARSGRADQVDENLSSWPGGYVVALEGQSKVLECDEVETQAASSPSPVPRLRLTVNMTPAERVAQRTWSTLGRAQQLRARFGEETLTDLLVLDMLPHQRTRGFWLRPTTKHAEHWCGADLFVAVRHPTGRWSRFALQAKKLCPERQIPDVERGAEVRQSIGQARVFRAAATRLAPLLALQPLEHRTAFRALALLTAVRRMSTGLHACPELAHSAHDLPSAPSEFRLGSQSQSGQTMALRLRLSRRRDITRPNGVSHSAS